MPSATHAVFVLAFNLVPPDPRLSMSGCRHVGIGRHAGGMPDARRLVDRLWSHANVLRDGGAGTIDYTEQLTYLLFLKIAHERATRPLKPERIVPDEYSWQRLLDADGAELETRYTLILQRLGRQPGAQEIGEDLIAALAEFKAIAASLRERSASAQVDP